MIWSIRALYLKGYAAAIAAFIKANANAGKALQVMWGVQYLYTCLQIQTHSNQPDLFNMRRQWHIAMQTLLMTCVIKTCTHLTHALLCLH